MLHLYHLIEICSCGSVTLNEKEDELIKGIEEINDAKEKIEESNDLYNDFVDSTKKIKEYNINVMGRKVNSGVVSSYVPSEIMGKVRYSLALSFVLVGLFVCYSVMSRLVYEYTILKETRVYVSLICFMVTGVLALISSLISLRRIRKFTKRYINHISMGNY